MERVKSSEERGIHPLLDDPEPEACRVQPTDRV
jgi:hypothetical protein